MYYTERRSEKNGQQEPVDQAKAWQSTQHANIGQNVASGVYYARLRVKGKLIWRSLKTDKISIAKQWLGDAFTLKISGPLFKKAVGTAKQT